jgi:hypothetical protein
MVLAAFSHPTLCLGAGLVASRRKLESDRLDRAGRCAKVDLSDLRRAGSHSAAAIKSLSDASSNRRSCNGTAGVAE